ncbi:MAG TPA: hypothetical protein VIJ34_10140 [Acidimicrobiales bacterium]
MLRPIDGKIGELESDDLVVARDRFLDERRKDAGFDPLVAPPPKR